VGTKYGIVSFSKHAGQGDGVNGYEILLSGLVAVPTAYGLGFWRGRRRRAQAEYLAAEEHQGEVIVRQTLTQHFSLPGYHLFNHLTLPAQDGTTEVDHVLVARTGIFVIEVKHYSGVITASREARRWIQRWPRRPAALSVCAKASPPVIFAIVEPPLLCVIDPLVSEEPVRALPSGSHWLFLYSKKLFDVLGEVVINLIMAWYGLLLAGCRIAVDIMPPTMPH
jgi:hypothetical protein